MRAALYARVSTNNELAWRAIAAELGVGLATLAQTEQAGPQGLLMHYRTRLVPGLIHQSRRATIVFRAVEWRAANRSPPPRCNLTGRGNFQRFADVAAQDGNAIFIAQSRRRHDVADPRVGPRKRIVRT